MNLKDFASQKKSCQNRDSILKGRDITLLTKVHIVKAMVFPVVVYGCKSWTRKKFSSVAQSCQTLCDPMACSTPVFLVHQQLLELAQTHVHRAGDAIQTSHSCHPLLLPSISPSIRVFSMSQFFAPGGQSIGISASASVLPMNIQDLFPLGLITQSGLKI